MTKNMAKNTASIQATYVHWLTNICSLAHEHMFMDKRTYVLRMMMVLLMMMGVSEVWGQVDTDYSGTYYIASNYKTANSNPAVYNYVGTTLTTDVPVLIVNTGGQTIASFTIHSGETVESPVPNTGVYIIRADKGRYNYKVTVK